MGINLPFKLTRKQKRFVALGIGVLFVLYGALGAFFKFQFNKTVVDQVSFILMMIAAVLLLGKDQPEPAKSEEAPTQESPAENPPPEIEEHKSER